MARPRSDDRRNAILAAATRVIAAEGLGAATAAIAKEACISNGSLFTYFETKADLLNCLYVELKAEMAGVAVDPSPVGTDVREQLFAMWSRSLRWAETSPEKRRTLAHLSVSDEITPESSQAAHRMMGGVGELMERCRANGAMRDAPLGLVVALMNAMADATIDFMVQDPDNADAHCATGFAAMWRVLGR